MMEGDLKNLVESSNKDEVLTEEIINEETTSMVEFVQKLNESFNNEEITEEEYYFQLEEGFGNMVKRAFGVGTDDKADQAGSLAQRKISHREKMRNAGAKKAADKREGWQSGNTPEGRRLDPATGKVTNPRGEVIKKKTSFSGVR